MTNYDVVKKLIGNVRPVGETREDEKRLENLKALCELMDEIHTEIDAVAYDFRNNHEYSIKEAVKVANDFLTKLGITE
jgi:hypothetical protein